jgi:hypothetical protein
MTSPWQGVVTEGEVLLQIGLREPIRPKGCTAQD